MIYTIAISEAERNHIKHILRMNMDDINGSAMDKQAYEAFVRGSIDNTRTKWADEAIAGREAHYYSAVLVKKTHDEDSYNTGYDEAMANASELIDELTNKICKQLDGILTVMASKTKNNGDAFQSISDLMDNYKGTN